MTRCVLRGSVLTRISAVLVSLLCLLACAFLGAFSAFAQHPVAHPVIPMHVPAVPHAAAPQPVSSSPAPISQPHVSGVHPVRGVAAGTFGFRRGPINLFRRPVFFGGPFFRFGLGYGLNSYWWPTCGPIWGWGFDCFALPVYGYGFENYVTPQMYEVPVYVYGEERHDRVQLYLKDGRMYNVTDYWFVDDQVHFTMLEQLNDGAIKKVERVLAFDELDLQTTIDVNTRRGFRLVMRDEPWEKYLRDHPDLTPPLVVPPPKE